MSGNINIGAAPKIDGVTWIHAHGGPGFGSMSSAATFQRVYSINDEGNVRVVIASMVSGSVNYPVHVVLIGSY